ncbi:hypothetical protein EXS70_00480 [Candidatus Peribacteria bacterium]|nr:hypothetical protein [Candidatus Peribacteria bacterium]
MNNAFPLLHSFFGVETAFANPIPYGSVSSPAQLTSAAFLLSLGFTVAIELVVVLIISSIFLRRQNISKSRLLLSAIVASTITLPLLWYVFLPRGANVILLEVAVVMIEALLYRYILPTRWNYALLLAVIANVVSFLASPILATYIVGTNPYL